MKRAIAHSNNSQGQPHYLKDHLNAVAQLAARVMPDSSYKQVAFYTGLWHDLGKYNPRWQTRLKAIALRQGERVGIPHAFQGAMLAFRYSRPAAFCKIIEAGVDLDFADGYRVVAPLDSIVQTAGRINRHGSLEKLGTLTVFKLQGGKFPGTDYENAARTSQILLDRGLDLNSPHIFHEYFKKRFRNQDTDVEKIQDARQKQQFESVSQKFRLIEEDSTSVFVADESESRKLLEELETKRNLELKDYQKSQQYLVNLRNSFLKKHPEDYREIENGLLIWKGKYNSKCGIM